MIVRLRFSKLGKIRWTSHRDVARIWERALRRAGLPVSYTGGFSPRPNLSFGLALPTGCESQAEYLDVRLDHDRAHEEVGRAVAATLPVGVEVMATGTPGSEGRSLQEDVTSCSWRISVDKKSFEQLEEAIDKVMSSPSLPVERERKGRRVRDDLRPSLLGLSAVEANEASEARRANEANQTHEARPTAPGANRWPSVELVAELGARPRGVRPAELAHVMGVEFGLVRRTHQWIERDGSRFEPLEVSTAATACGVASLS